MLFLTLLRNISVSGIFPILILLQLIEATVLLPSHASVTIDLAAGQLTVTGDDNPNEIEISVAGNVYTVSSANGDTVSVGVDDTGTASGSGGASVSIGAATSDVESIAFETLGGADKIAILSVEDPVVANTGGGDDLMSVVLTPETKDLDVTYNGGTEDTEEGDVLSVAGDSSPGASASYRGGPSGPDGKSGTLEFSSGLRTCVVRFTGLEPVFVTNQQVFGLIVMGTDNTINIVPGPPSPNDGQPTYQVNFNGEFEAINFNRIQNLEIRASVGGDSFTMNLPNHLGDSFGGLFLNGGEDGDTFSIEATPPGVNTTVVGGTGNDTIDVGGPAGLDTILGPILVNGQDNDIAPTTQYEVSANGISASYVIPDGDHLHIRDGASAATSNYTIADATVTRTGAGNIRYLSSIERLTIDTSDTAASNVVVTGTLGLAATTINMGDMADDIDVLATGLSSVTAINAGSGADTIDLAMTGDDSLTFLRGEGGADVISVEDTGVGGLNGCLGSA